MFNVSKRTLKWLAALVWMIGGTILLLKAYSLLKEANAITLNPVNIAIAVAVGLLLGSAKAFFLFRKSCRRNLARIDKLERPQVWQFYRPGFFFLLALMITTGATLSRLAHGNYPFLIGVAILDMSIGMALLGSSVLYWGSWIGRITAVRPSNQHASHT